MHSLKFLLTKLAYCASRTDKSKLTLKLTDIVFMRNPFVSATLTIGDIALAFRSQWQLYILLLGIRVAFFISVRPGE